MANRFERSIDYFAKSRALFEELEQPAMVSSMYFNEGRSQILAGSNAQACEAFDKSLAWQETAVTADPDHVPLLPEGVSSFAVLIDLLRREAGCPA